MEIKPETYKTLKGAERGIAAITRKHSYTKKEDIEIVELTSWINVNKVDIKKADT